MMRPLFTLLTAEPSPDVAPIHDRQMMILRRGDWSAWLDISAPKPNSCSRCRRATAEPAMNVALSEARKTMPLALS
jgi:putative SOS response-associated peptidase YedK